MTIEPPLTYGGFSDRVCGWTLTRTPHPRLLLEEKENRNVGCLIKKGKKAMRRMGAVCAIIIAFVCSPAVVWGASKKIAVTHIVCPLCTTDNDLTSWDGAHEYRCTKCGLPLRYPRPKTLVERIASFRPNGHAIQGSLAFEGTGYRERAGASDRLSDCAAALHLQWKRTFGRAHVFIDGFAADDTREDRVAYEQVPLRQPAIVGLREAFVDVSVFGVECRFGKQLWSFGKADLVHLVDVLNPEDRTNLFHEERLGSWGATFSRRFGETNIDLVAVPRLSPTLLPASNSRYAIALFDLRDAELETLREGVAVRIVRTDFDIDWSIIGARSAELTPSAIFTSPIAPPSLVYPERTIFGVTGETVFGDYGVRGEAVSVVPADALADRRAAIVLGVDRSWQDIFTPLDHLYMNIEGVVEHVTREGSGIEFPRPFTRTMAAKVEYTVERWVPSCTLVHSFGRAGTVPRLDAGDSYVEARVRFERTDYDEIEVRADVPLGSETSFFGSQEKSQGLSVLWRIRF